MKTFTLCLLLAALLLPSATASAAAGDSDGDDATTAVTDLERVDLGAPAEIVDAQREQWAERFRAARDAVAEARLRNALAQDAYREMRHRRNQTGEEKERILAEIGDSEVALVDAEAALKELFEAARRAGVPPGWMRMARSEAPAAGAPDPEPEP